MAERAAMAAKARVRAVWGRWAAAAPAAAAGRIPAAANAAPAFHRTRPARACAYRAVRDVAVTMIRLAVVAAAGVKPSR
jgi:hypothetical protein